jgi:dihydrofolate reductase
MLFKIISAIDENSGIGQNPKQNPKQNHSLPWSFKKEFKHFSEKTKESPPNTKNAIIMGRKTWTSLPNGTLPGRDNLVLTRGATPNKADDTCSPEPNNLFFFNDFDSIHEFCKRQDYNIVWIIGGG